MSPKIKLTYFDIEGLGEQVRLTLLLSGTPFEDERIAWAQWKDMKPNTPFGKLPLMKIDDGPVRSQSMAMVRWVGSSFSETLYPADKIFDIEEAIGLIEDIRLSWRPQVGMSLQAEAYGYPEGFDKTEEGEKLIKTMREKWLADELPQFARFVQTKLDGNDWIAGTKTPTIADCIAVPFLRSFTRGYMDHVPATALDDYPVIVAYIKRFCDIPEIRGRYSSGLY